MKKTGILYIQKDGIMGGSAMSLQMLIRAVKKEYDLHVLFCEKGPFYDQLKRSGVPLLFIPFRAWRKVKYFIRNISAVFQLRKIIKEKGISVVHSNSYEVNPLMVLACQKRTRTICHVRDFITRSKARKFFLHRADRVIAVSRAVRDQFRDLHQDISVIYNGVSVRSAAQAQDSLSGRFPRIKRAFKAGLIGQCEERKRQEDFVRAGLEVLQKDAAIHFFLIGGHHTEYGDRIKQLIRHHQAHFHFIDPVKDILPVIKGLNAVVISSREEAFGRTAIEAMACGRPVIASSVGGLAEIISHKRTGLLYPCNDHKALAGLILELKRDRKLYCKLVHNGLLHVKKNFTEEQYIRKIRELYSRVLAKDGVS
ncbi:MAG: glycosyltransferase family 4 protein [bacterium]|nr:glycosyltransferase family 4 protein [bacterium]